MPLVRRAFLLLAAPIALSAQRDPMRAASLETVVVTAERTRTTLGNSTAAVTRIEGTELARLPHATVADVLRMVPGFAVVNFDGLGNDPQLMTRGFYGGGEAEYVIVMVDGIPVDQLHTGLIPWDALPPLGAIDAVEVVRGGASALYGSSAIGAVINVITRRNAAAARWDVSGGTFGAWRVGADVGGSLGSLSAGIDRSDGFRSHSERTAGRTLGRVTLANRVTITATSHWRAVDEPGPLLESLLRENRRMSDSLFRVDHTDDRAYSLILDGRRGRLTGSLGGEFRRTDAVRTIPLAPSFGDTKERVARNARAAGSVQLDLNQLTLGVDAGYGTLDSKYYETVNGERGDLDASGDGSRTTAALFAQYTLQPTDAVRLSLGSRFDWLDDTFDGRGASHSAFSPKLGVNVRVVPSAHFYLAASRSFKAPTLDQLFDQRSIPVPFPPFSITTSNRTLEPQYGMTFEGGVYHAAGRLTTSLSLYQMDMKDELDFDVQTLRYVNIGRSRHRGLELGVRGWGLGVSPFLTYGLQAVTARSGENSGRQLKAVPRHTLSGGLMLAPWRAITASVVATHHAQMFLDDANTRRIPDYTRVDAQLGYAVTRTLRLTLEASNLFDATYSSTAFPDPAGGSEAYFYPAAGRALRLGIRHGW